MQSEKRGEVGAPGRNRRRDASTISDRSHASASLPGLANEIVRGKHKLSDLLVGLQQRENPHAFPLLALFVGKSPGLWNLVGHFEQRHSITLRSILSLIRT